MPLYISPRPSGEGEGVKETSRVSSLRVMARQPERAD